MQLSARRHAAHPLARTILSSRIDRLYGVLKKGRPFVFLTLVYATVPTPILCG